MKIQKNENKLTEKVRESEVPIRPNSNPFLFCFEQRKTIIWRISNPLSGCLYLQKNNELKPKAVGSEKTAWLNPVDLRYASRHFS